jgi:hypothetical protein
LVGTSCDIAIGTWYQHLHGLLRWIIGAVMTAVAAAVVRGGGGKRTRRPVITQKSTAGVRAARAGPLMCLSACLALTSHFTASAALDLLGLDNAYLARPCACACGVWRVAPLPLGLVVSPVVLHTTASQRTELNAKPVGAGFVSAVSPPRIAWFTSRQPASSQAQRRA